MPHSTSIKQPYTKLLSPPNSQILATQPTQPAHQSHTQRISHALKVRRMDCEPDHTPHSNVKGYTFTPPYAFTAMVIETTICHFCTNPVHHAVVICVTEQWRCRECNEQTRTTAPPRPIRSYHNAK